jgi:hypothetical protein
MSSIWRFYVGEDRRWRWQCLSASQALIAESPTGYKEYDQCMASAKGKGYVFHPSQAKAHNERSR